MREFLPYMRGAEEPLPLLGEIEKGQPDEFPSLLLDLSIIDLVTHGYQGLCITRLPPKMVREQLGLEKTPVLWLSRLSSEKNSISPWPLEGISVAVEHFISSGEKTIILLDGVEYITSHNDFKSMLTLLHDIKERMAMMNSILVLPLDSEVFEEREFALIRRDLVQLPPSTEQAARKRADGMGEEEFERAMTRKPAEAGA